MLVPEFAYECATCGNANNWLDRVMKLLQAGAYAGLEESDIIESEATKLQPCADIIDHNKTEHILHEGFRSIDNQMSQRLFRDFLQSKEWIRDMARECAAHVKSNHKNVYSQVKKTKKIPTIAQIVSHVDAEYGFDGIRKKVFDTMKKPILSPDSFCTSRDWFVWHINRLYLFMVNWYAYKKIKAGTLPKDENFVHDCMDVSYVSRLAVADVLITNDKDLAVPLAGAAYPNKRVYTSIDEFLSA